MPQDDWFWEGNIQARVEEHLRKEGWDIISSSDTASRQPGIDLVLQQDGQRLNIEVKGWPSKTYSRGPKAGQPKPTNPSLQARHWYAGALLTSALLRDADSEARVAMAFPDMRRYKDLLRRTAASLEALRVDVLLVEERGSVQWVDPGTLPLPGRHTAASTGPVRRVNQRLGTASGSLTLHEAMALVLREAPDSALHANALTEEINRRDLYRMRDGRPVAPGQIHARARNYGHLFRVAEGIVSLQR